MATPRENFTRVIKTGKPTYVAPMWDFSATGNFFSTYFVDPYSLADIAVFEPGASGYDSWGVKRVWDVGAPAPHPSPYDDDIVVRDLNCWEDFVQPPKVEGGDWSEVEEKVNAVDRQRHLVVSAIFPGIFEWARELLGFENCLKAFYKNPIRLTDLMTCICDVKLEIVEQVINRLKPDMIHSHDDWGSQQALLIRPSMWREMIKPHYERLYGYVKSKGVLISHHADCFCKPIVEDMVDLGIDVWQGPVPENNIPEVQMILGGRMTLMGGINATVVDKPGISEEEIRAEVRRCLKECCPGGYFIACVTSEAALDPAAQEIIDDELRKTDVSIYG